MMNTSRILRSRTILAVCAGALIVALSGCAALTTLIGAVAAYNTIKSLFHGKDDPAPGYELSGYVYIDHSNNKIGITSTPVAPTDGNYVPFGGATVSIDTTPPRTGQVNATTGYFHWVSIPDTRLVLTVQLPDNAGSVQFDVVLNSGSISPHV